MSTETSTLTADDAVALADTLNQRFEAGVDVRVNGFDLWTRHGKVASSWQNGSVSFQTRAKAKGKTRTVFVKVGQQVTVETRT